MSNGDKGGRTLSKIEWASSALSRRWMAVSPLLGHVGCVASCRKKARPFRESAACIEYPHPGQSNRTLGRCFRTTSNSASEQIVASSTRIS